MCVCAGLCVCVCVHMCIYTCVGVCARVRTHTSCVFYVQAYVYICVYIIIMYVCCVYVYYFAFTTCGKLCVSIFKYVYISSLHMITVLYTIKKHIPKCG